MYKVLIVDDEKETVESIQNFLEKHGFEVFSAYDGEAGKKKISKIMPDIVLLDLLMPETNGFEVMQWMRQNCNTRIPVIILSVKDKLDDIKKGYHLDADFYLPKPFVNADLLRGIQTVLSLHSFRQDQGQ